MSANSERLAETLGDLSVLEHRFRTDPDQDTAAKLFATRQVAQVLSEKVEQERAGALRRERDDRRAEFQNRYHEINERLNVLYAEAEDGLTRALDATDEAVNLYHESRRLASFITKMDGDVRRLERSFWSRHPRLRERFVNSVLRNGEP